MSIFSKHLWLIPDDPEGTWWCRCRVGVVDAPWHTKESYPDDGNGWLWTCAKCGRAFMFARCVRIRGSLERLARRRTPREQRYLSQTGEPMRRTLMATPQDWLDVAVPIARSIREGERYVFFDGQVLPARHGPVKFDGLWRSHDLPDLPHLNDSDVQNTLGNFDYWFDS